MAALKVKVENGWVKIGDAEFQATGERGARTQIGWISVSIDGSRVIASGQMYTRAVAP